MDELIAALRAKIDAAGELYLDVDQTKALMQWLGKASILIDETNGLAARIDNPPVEFEECWGEV